MQLPIGLENEKALEFQNLKLDFAFAQVDVTHRSSREAARDRRAPSSLGDPGSAEGPEATRITCTVSMGTRNYVDQDEFHRADRRRTGRT